MRVDPNVLYVDEGDLLTSAGSAASIDLCLHVVQRDYGAEVATRLARDLVVPLHRDGGQPSGIPAELRRERRVRPRPVVGYIVTALTPWRQVNTISTVILEVLH